MITLHAPAKLNLYLHITGRRSDGYHLLDSLFVFTTYSDIITITPSDQLSLTIDGDFYAALSDELIEKNLVYRAAKILREKYTVKRGAHIHLKKQIPVGSGLGGGSSDAATVLKGLNAFWNLQCDDKTLMAIGLTLGADIPACIIQKPAIVSGIGEQIMPVSLPFSRIPVLLMNPNQALSTQAVYQQFQKNNRPFTAISLDENAFTSWDAFTKTVLNKHNDLELPATQLQPTIEKVLHHLSSQPGCLLARMSGSGATCFALFATHHAAIQAHRNLSTQFPTYWMRVSDISSS